MPEQPTENTANLRAQAERVFRSVQERLATALEAVEAGLPPDAPEGARPPVRFSDHPWSRSGDGDSPEGEARITGGGVSRRLSGGRVLEKAAVNCSAVEGRFGAAMAARIPGATADPRFTACGVSAIVHPRNPHLPTAHLNLRFLTTTRWWFGGGADITPMVDNPPATAAFLGALEATCASHPQLADWERFRKWCDTYFWLPHRGEARGAGGIFYDYMGPGGEVPTDSASTALAFSRALGDTFIECYPALLRRDAARPWSEDDRAHQLRRRGRYVEFNLLWDRGTRFGLETGGNPDAILASMPPLAAWD